MASASMGSFGAYKLAYSRHRRAIEDSERDVAKRVADGPKPAEPEAVWVVKRYVPHDLRFTAPVPRHKALVENARELAVEDESWIPASATPISCYVRNNKNAEMFNSTPSTRDESWSTLREMLPSWGRSDRHRPPNWGTGFAKPPPLVHNAQRKFYIYKSPMSRFVDDMHVNTRLFQLY